MIDSTMIATHQQTCASACDIFHQIPPQTAEPNCWNICEFVFTKHMLQINHPAGSFVFTIAHLRFRKLIWHAATARGNSFFIFFRVFTFILISIFFITLKCNNINYKVWRTFLFGVKNWIAQFTVIKRKVIIQFSRIMESINSAK